MVAQLKGTKIRDVQFGVRIPQTLKDSIKEHSDQSGMTMSDITIAALQRYLGAEKTFKPVPMRQRYKGAK